MSAEELIQDIKNITAERFRQSMSFLLRNIPPEKVDEMREYIEKLNEIIKTGEALDAADMVASLLDPRKFNLPQELIEDFLRNLLIGEPDADRVIAGTIEMAKRRLWGRNA